MEEVNESEGQEQTEINIGNDPVMLTGSRCSIKTYDSK